MNSQNRRTECVFLAGMAGFNRGDDAIARVLLGSLLAGGRFSRAIVTVQRKNIFKSSRIAEVRLSRKSPVYHWNLIVSIVKADLVVIGGGSIIQDEFGATWYRGITSLFAEIVFLARLFGKPVITAPIGVDALQTSKGRALARFVLTRCREIVVRDSLSANNAASIVGELVPIRVAADPVFALDGQDDTTLSGEYLTVCPALEGVGEDRLIDCHVSLIERYLELRPSAQVVILAMDDRVIEDAGKIEAVRSGIRPVLKNRIRCVVPKSDLEARAILRQSSLVLAMRLHAMIISYSFAPIFCLSRGTKTDAISSVLGVPAESVRPGFNLSNIIEVWTEFLSTSLDWGHRDKPETIKRLADMREKYVSFERALDTLIDAKKMESGS